MSEPYWDSVSIDDPFLCWLFRIFSYFFFSCMAILLFSGMYKLMIMFYLEAFKL